MRKLAFKVFAVSLGVALGLSGAQANLLVNPGFETGDFTGWSPGTTGWRASDYAADTYGESLWGAVDDVLPEHDPATQDWRILDQLVSVIEGRSYSGGVYIRAALVEADASESWFEVQWLNGLGETMWGFGYGTAHVTADQDFTYAGMTDMIAPAGAVQASVRGVVHMLSQPDDADYHVFDDFDFDETIPEPTTLTLIGAALGVVTILRRRAGANR
ncbi:MAG: PEP-CTERM sorting domain-containing protein [Kiritimatiellae bacterium]|nr:PEP-CTERM sorting domain-containing protein [Kiritimatiellia bacterium]